MSELEQGWKQFICRACGLIYDEEKGDPDSGLPPGTRFADIPDDWACPLCGVVKSDFEPYTPASLSFAREQGTKACGVHVRNKLAGIIVLGGGTAGWSVVEAIRALDTQAPITLVSNCEADRYHKPELSIALSRGISPESLIRETGRAAAARLNVRLMARTQVFGLSPLLKQVRTTRGTLRYSSLILAQGARPSVPVEISPTLCRRVNDLAGWTGLRNALVGGARRIAIVGAGMVGCELAEDFTASGHSVTLLDVHAEPMASMLPSVAGQRLRLSLEKLGIKYVGETRVTGVTALPDGSKRISLSGARTFTVDEIVVAAGLATDNRLAQMSGLSFNRGFEVDPATLQTSAPHIYALGDCVSIQGAPCRFIEPIVRQADAIAHAVMGIKHDGYRHRTPVIRLKTRSLPVIIHGQPDVNGNWKVESDVEHHFSMAQWRDGNVVARLELGSPLLTS